LEEFKSKEGHRGSEETLAPAKKARRELCRPAEGSSGSLWLSGWESWKEWSLGAGKKKHQGMVCEKKKKRAVVKREGVRVNKVIRDVGY